MKHLYILIITLTFSFSQGSRLSDSLALIEVYNLANGDNGLNPWDLNQTMDTWSGVILDANGRVTSLSATNWSGNLAPDIGLLSKLQILNLSLNRDLTGQLPEEIGDLTELTQLNLAGCSFTDTIPNSISNLNRVSFLSLSNNLLNGKIPEDIGNIAFLEFLYLNDNNLTGEIPISMGALPNIKRIKLYNNKLEGNIPNQLVNLKFTIEELGLHNNKFTGMPNFTLHISSFIWGLTVQNNQLTFDDIEPNANITGIIYSPQDSIGLQQNIQGDTYTNLNLSTIPVDGTANTYQWYKDGNPIVGATSASHQINSLKLSDSGEYILQISNAIATNLTLIARSILVEVQATPRYLDSLALVALYNSTSGLVWGNKWDLSKPMDQFYGVTLTDRRVTGINLSYNLLNGSIPADLSLLTNLKELNLQNNNIANIPQELGDVTSLELLNLSNNPINGPLPIALANLGNLQYLILSQCGLTGSILGYSSLVNLKQLNLSSNNLVGQIPSIFTSMVNLKWLNLRDNNFSGNFPISLTNLSNLEELYISGNSLTGTLPTSIGSMVNLEVLMLNQNLFNGSLPSTISNMVNLRELSIYSNLFTGAIPESFTALNNLKWFNLSNNQFDKLPNLSGLDSIEVLNVSGNNLEFGDLEPNSSLFSGSDDYAGQTLLGEIELRNISEFTNHIIAFNVGGDSTQYQWFKDGSAISGATDDTLMLISVSMEDDGNYFLQTTNPLFPGYQLNSYPITITVVENQRLADSLALVHFYNEADGGSWTNNTNWLSSNPIDSWFGITMTDDRVTSINLSNNGLSGTISDSLYNLNELKELVLNSNELTGLISPSIEKIVNLIRLNLSSNQLSGSLPESFFTLIELRELNLSNNNINGPITYINQFTKLQYLDLANNEFNNIIPSIITLFNLRFIDFSDNQFNGTIPTNIGDLESLRFLNLSVNQLLGDLNNSILNLDTLNFIDLSDNLISNIPNLSPIDSLQQLYISKNHLTFEDIEPNISLFSDSTNYSPQDSFQISPFAFGVALGEKLVINGSIGGTANVYQWYKDDLPIPGATHDSLVLTNASFLDEGDYSLKVTSMLVPDLSIYSYPIPIFINFTGRQLDSLALLELYNSTNGDNWTYEVDEKPWDFTKSIDSLAGVTITDDRVSAIDLGGHNLVDTIPNILFDLTQLTSLKLDGNRLVGSISPLISNFSKLETLWLQNNQLMGSIPASIGSLEALSKLRIYGNSLSGELPPALGDLSNLTQLWLHRNNLSGSIPNELGQLENVTNINLSENNLSGFIPADLALMSDLNILNLSENQFTGSFPDFTGHAEISKISINGNQISSLPDLTGVTNLVELKAENNRLDFVSLELNSDLIISSVLTYEPQAKIGEFQEFNILPNNQEINFSINVGGTALSYQWYKNDLPIDGATSDTIIVRTTETSNYYCEVNHPTISLTLTSKDFHVIVHENSIIADSLAVAFFEASTSLDWIDSLPFTSRPGLVFDANRLTEINFVGFGISGTLPSELGFLTALKKLRLSNNNLTGELPIELGNMESLEFLHLNNNAFTGQIPNELGQLSALRQLHLNNNQLNGNISSELSNASQLTHLDLSQNRLTGQIPNEFSSLVNLEIFKIYLNEIEGNIPASFQNLTNLSDFQIYSNELVNLPDLSNLNFTNFLVLNNKFTFEDIEPNINQNNFFYTPQDSVGENISIVGLEAENKIIKTEIGGSANIYKWFKNDVELINQTSDSLVLENLQLTDAGTYRYQVDNSIVTDLTLHSLPISLEIVTDSLQIDSLALVDLYNSTDGENWNSFAQWDFSKPLDSLFGVTIVDDRVTELRLNNAGLSGQLPTSLGNLTELKILIMSRNSLTGELPETIGQLSQLEEMKFHIGNSIAGAIPESIGNLSNLKILWLDENQISGSIPSSIAGLASIEWLSFGNNPITGEIPVEIGQLTTLKTLALNETELSGEIPTEIGDLVNLEGLNISSGFITGNLPSELWQLTNLTGLHIQKNANKRFNSYQN